MGEFYNTSYEIFPKNEKVPSETKIISAGDCGHIYIYINFCNNGFYDVENESDDIDDIEICSKMTPKGYYLNKDDYKYTFKKCHPYCSECITGSNDDSNMKCLGCINGFEYDDKTFNCYNILGPKKPEEIKKKINKYFWVFLFIFLLAIFLTIFLIWNDIFIKPKIKNNNIEEQQNLIEQKVDNLMIKLI